MSNTFEEALGIHPVQKVEQPKQEVLPPEKKEEPVVLEKDAQEDYDLSRDVFRELITKGNEAIDGINQLAKLSDSPRAYEVLATLIKTVSETTKDLYDLQKKTKELKQFSAPGKKVLNTGEVNIDKAVFVGTTTDLLDRLKKQDENEH
jgi:Terminase DNA packaging enzyme